MCPNQCDLFCSDEPRLAPVKDATNSTQSFVSLTHRLSLSQFAGSVPYPHRYALGAQWQGYPEEGEQVLQMYIAVSCIFSPLTISHTQRVSLLFFTSEYLLMSVAFFFLLNFQPVSAIDERQGDYDCCKSVSVGAEPLSALTSVPLRHERLRSPRWFPPRER